jgi:ABC-2 type transport system ATP-binding protein
MLGEFYQLGRSEARRRAESLLDEFRLSGAADRRADTYSGGMRRRLDLAASLIGRPPVLILDEPTTGLDPRTRLELWATIERLVAEGTTVLLTTQYLEEADQLAHRIVVIDRGHVIATGTADELKAQLGGDVIELRVDHVHDLDTVATALTPFARDGVTVDASHRRITLPAPEGSATLRAVLGELEHVEIAVDDIGIRRPSLDEVFLVLTGHSTSDDRDPDSALVNATTR